MWPPNAIQKARIVISLAFCIDADLWTRIVFRTPICRFKGQICFPACASSFTSLFAMTDEQNTRPPKRQRQSEHNSDVVSSITEREMHDEGQESGSSIVGDQQAEDRSRNSSGNTIRPSSRIQGLERSFIGRLVAFSPSLEPWMRDALYRPAGSTFIIGRICDYRYAKRQGLYEVRWLDSIFQKRVEKIDLGTIRRGRENYDQLHARRDNPRWNGLCAPGALCVDDADDLEEYREFDTHEPLPATIEEVEKLQNMKFDPAASLRAPSSLYSRADGSSLTTVKPEFTHLFEHSASSSFFAYLPICFWRQVLTETNAEALEKNVTNETFTMEELMKFLGILWFMAVVDKGEYNNYWGEQVESAVFETKETGLENVMPLRRFKLLRSAFCFRRSSDVTPEDSKHDAAIRIRTLLNMLKQTASKYVDVGRDLAVDEASVAARSKFARHLIVYNPRKPTGKYHFKFYMMCCSTTWLCLNFRLHCESTLQSRLENVADEQDINALDTEMKATTKTRQNVLELVRPYFGTNRIVNCDNYYTSVQLVEALRLKGLFCRGTVRRFSKHFPQHVVLGDPMKSDKNSNKSQQKRRIADANTNTSVRDESEILSNVGGDNGGSSAEDVSTRTSNDGQDDDQARANTRVGGEVQRGDYRQAVSRHHKMIAASWCDGNVVTIVSNADPTTVASVKRSVGGKQVDVPAPSCIKEYNKNMQGVDRHDQLRARFSVADGHSFQKWYKKLGLAVIDIARVNAFLTQKLVKRDARNERDTHRQFLIDLIKEMFGGKWRNAPGNATMLFSSCNDCEVDGMSGNHEQPVAIGALSLSSTLPSPACNGIQSMQVFENSRRKRMCVVCRFEGRKDTISTEWCVEHNVSLCKRVHEGNNREYGCPHDEWTCWDKFHRFYYPLGLFSERGCVKRSCALFKEKKR